MDLALKQRLVGASVLIAIAVIFLPLLFDDSNQDENQSISIEIPKEPIELKHKVLAIDGSHEPKQNVEKRQKMKIDDAPIIKKETIIEIVDNSKNNNEPVELAIKKSDIIKNNTPVVKITTPKEKKSFPKVEPKPVIISASSDSAIANDKDTRSSYRIKLGVFSQIKNAQKIKAKLIHNGIDALVEKDAATGLYKVYSKQYIDIGKTKKINQRIQKLKLNIGKTSIETLNKSASDDAELMLDTGWIVQIGIFSSQENSIKLRNKIRKKGFVSFVDSITNSSNKKMFRVRIGPFATRDEAVGELKQVKKNMNLKGLVKPHEKQKVVL